MDKNYYMNSLVWRFPTGYVNEALNIVRGQEWFMGFYNNHYQLLTIRPKGYQLFLALLMNISLSNFIFYSRMTMIICNVIAGLFIYYICDHLFHNKKLSYFAFYLWAINPFAIFTCIQDLPDGFGCFFVSFILFLYYHPIKKQLLKYLLLGVVIGVSASFRSEYFLIIAIVLLIDFINCKNRKKHCILWLTMILSFFAIVSPWAIYSYKKSGHVLFTSTSAWGSAYMAIGEKKDNAIGTGFGDGYVDYIAQKNGIDGAYLYDGNVFFKKKVFTIFKRLPIRIFRNCHNLPNSKSIRPWD